MPVSTTYPGVYIEEVPSGVRTIMGVATSITAFIGRAPRGPVNEPTDINSWSDYERRFGGLDVEHPLSYAVNDFFLNGGKQALIVRLFKASGDGDGVAALDLGTLKLVAREPGEWGNSLRAWVEHPDTLAKKSLGERYGHLGLGAEDFFDLIIWERPPTITEQAELAGRLSGTLERFRNLTVKDGPRRVDRVLENESSLVRVAPGELPEQRPERIAQESKKSATNGARSKELVAADYTGRAAEKSGLYALDKADIFNLLCIPPDGREGKSADIEPSVYQEAMAYCAQRRAILIVDPPLAWGADPTVAAARARDGLGELGLTGVEARNATLYFPRFRKPDPLRDGQLDTFVACGAVAGRIARTDVERGIWKAPAGIDAAISGIQGLQLSMTDEENGMLNPLGINCLRSFRTYGRVIWGARTLRGADQAADEYKYLPVRRLALYIEESLYRGTQWVVFEPNDEPLWAQIRLNIGAFMMNLFRQGAFQGSNPRDAFFVKCDRETTTQNDINRGVVNILVGFMPLKPAEFVIIRIQQMAGKIEA